MRDQVREDFSNGAAWSQTLTIDDIMEETHKSRRTILRQCNNGTIPEEVFYRVTPCSAPLFIADQWEKWKRSGGANSARRRVAAQPMEAPIGSERWGRPRKWGLAE
jgi:hypothetical protein